MSKLQVDNSIEDRLFGVGLKLKHARESRDLSIDELAALCQMSSVQMKSLEDGSSHLDIYHVLETFSQLGYELDFKEQTLSHHDGETRLRKQNNALRMLLKHEFVLHGEVSKAVELITESVGKIFGAEFTGVWLLNKAKDYLQVIDEYSLNENEHGHDQKYSFKQKDWPIWFEKLQARRDISSNNETELNDNSPEYAEEKAMWGVKSALETTILLEGEAIGVISCEDTRERSWSADEISFHHQIADVIASTIRNGELIKLERLFERQKQRVEKQQKTIMEMIQHRTVVSGYFRPACDYICKSSSQLYQASCVTIWYADNDKTMRCMSRYNLKENHFVADLGLELFSFALDELPVYIETLASDRVFAVNDMSLDVRVKDVFNKKVSSFGIQSMLSAGIRIAGKLIGFISIESAVLRKWKADEKSFIGEITDQLAQTIINRERRQAEHQFKMLSRAVENTATAVLIVGLDDVVQYCNPQLLKMIDYDMDSVIDEKFKALPVANNSIDSFLEIENSMQVPEAWQGEIELVGAGDEPVWVLLSMSPVYDDYQQVSEFVCVCDDITAIKYAHKKMEQLAFYDVLTGLVNRRLFRERLEQSVRFCQRNKTKTAMLYLDLDRFKIINDTLGHDAGDCILVTVADRLKESVRNVDTVARLGGDEFSVLLPDVKDRKGVKVVAEKIIKALRKPIKVGDRDFIITVSIGICIYPDDSNNINFVMKSADVAMYHAKTKGKNGYQFYKEEFDVFNPERLSLESELRHALSNEEFVVHYQPIVKPDHSIECLEALIRWQHPEQGLVLPMMFIPVAEDLGLINDIGEWVLKRACTELKKFQKNGHPNVSVAVNLAATQFTDPDLADKVEKVLKEVGLSSKHLVLEITETMVMQDIDGTIDTMSKLKGLGVSLSIDDFGTGYSSLSYLKRLPMDHLKVDRSFIKDIHKDYNDEDITTAVIGMAHKLNLEVIAEGIEQWEQESVLKKHHCDFYQGFLYSKPEPMNVVLAKFESDSSQRTYH